MTEEQRVILQIVQIVIEAPGIEIDVLVYPGKSLVALSFEEDTLEAREHIFYVRVELGNKYSANRLHRLYETLKQRKEELK